MTARGGKSHAKITLLKTPKAFVLIRYRILPPLQPITSMQSYTDDATIQIAPNAMIEGAVQLTSSSSSSPSFQPEIVKEQDRQQFTASTLSLLQTRLKYASINVLVMLSIAYIGNLAVGNYRMLTLRTLVLASLIASYLIMRQNKNLSNLVLRSIESILFGGVAIQFAVMMSTRLIEYADRQDATSLVGTHHLYMTAFCLHIMTYGFFMPNTWKRAAIVTLCLAAIPYVAWFITAAYHPNVETLFATNKATSPVSFTLISALIASFGSHIINASRKEAFQAKQMMQYRLKDRIGSGGMGDVYRAEHVLLKRSCAIKLIHADKALDQATLERFEKEVIATAKLSHWNTIDIYDYGHTPDGTFYYVMELLDGMNLQDLVNSNGPLQVERAVYLILQACDALSEAHSKGLIHRDIKPGNLFVTNRGGHKDVMKVLDFGLVKELNTELVSNDPSQANKTPGRFSGTPLYMAPEQAFHYEGVDARSDLYALGAVLFFVLTGQPPFQRPTVAQLLTAHIAEPVPKPSSIRNAIPACLDAVVLKCMAKEREDRYQSAAELSEALRETALSDRWAEQCRFSMLAVQAAT